MKRLKKLSDGQLNNLPQITPYQAFRYYFDEVRSAITGEINSLEDQVKSFQIGKFEDQRWKTISLLNFVLANINACGFPREIADSSPIQNIEDLLQEIKEQFKSFKFTEVIKSLKGHLNGFETLIKDNEDVWKIQEQQYQRNQHQVNDVKDKNQKEKDVVKENPKPISDVPVQHTEQENEEPDDSHFEPTKEDLDTEAKKAKVLEYLEQGYTFTNIEKLFGITNDFIHYHRKIDKGFAQKVNEILEKQNRAQIRKNDTETIKYRKQVILERSRRGDNLTEILKDIGTSPSWLSRHKEKDKAFKEQLDDILRSQGRDRMDSSDHEERERRKQIVIQRLREGWTLKRIYEEHSISDVWIRREREVDEEFDRQVTHYQELNNRKTTQPRDEEEAEYRRNIILLELKQGLTFEEIHKKHKISLYWMKSERAKNKKFGDEVNKILEYWGRYRLPTTNVETAVERKKLFLDKMNEGYTLNEAADLLKISIGWIELERRRDPKFNDDILSILGARGHKHELLSEEEVARREKVVIDGLKNGLSLEEINEKYGIDVMWVAYRRMESPQFDSDVATYHTKKPHNFKQRHSTNVIKRLISKKY